MFKFPFRPKLLKGYIMKPWYLTDDSDNETDSTDDEVDTGDDSDDGDADDSDDEGDLNDGLPESSTTFSETFESEAETVAVAALVEEIASEESESTVFTDEYLSDEEEYGDFLGVYDVSADTGVMTLASPTAIEDEYVDSAVVMHYDEETDTWENVENVEIVDGYVYAEFTSLSPVAVYTKRKKVTVSHYEGTKKNMYFVCANGLPVTIEASETDGYFKVTDVYGNDAEYPITYAVIGGYYNGKKNLAKGSIKMLSGQVASLVAGSVNFDADSVSDEDVSIIMDGGKVSSTTSASIGRVRTTKCEVTMNNDANVYALACGSQSYFDVSDVNTKDADINSDAYLLEGIINVNGGTCDLVYGGGSSGYGYVQKATINFNNGTSGYVLGPSNGNIDELIINVADGNIGILQSVNRGTMKSASFDVSGGTVDKFFLGGDSTDSTVTGTVDSVVAEISGGSHNLYPGTTAGSTITSSDNIIKSVKISDGTVAYMDGFDEEFASVIETI